MRLFGTKFYQKIHQDSAFRYFIGTFMAAYKLAAAIFATVILFTLAFFPVSGYLGTMAMGTIDVYGDCHSS
jgi:hypothetical protein